VVFLFQEITGCIYQQWITLQHMSFKLTSTNASSVIRTCHTLATDDVMDAD